MKKITCLIVLLFLCAQISYSQDIYKRIIINNDSQSTINTLLSNGIDLRCGAIFKNNTIQLELSEAQLAIIDNAGISYNITIEDLTTFYNEQNQIEFSPEVNSAQTKNTNASGNFNAKSISSTILDNYLQYNECDEVNWVTPTNYNQGSLGGCLTVDQMESELDQMRSLYPGLISEKADASPTNQTTWGNPSGTITNNGLSYTGQGTTRWDPKTMWYVRITGDQSSPEGSKPQILYTSMIHAREVSSLMSNMYFMWYILENYNTDLAIKNLVDNNELYFIPVVNPDGLRWNQHLNANGGTFQRKNCRPNTGSTSNTTATRGVDVNRNFDYLWGADGDSSGSSDIPTSDTYRGPSPFSEPESQILRDFVLARDFETCLMHHSAANAIPHPYGGVPTRVSNREDEMHQWHEDMTMYNRYVSGATIFTPANGIADDWMLGGTPDGGNTTSNANNSFPNHSSGSSIGSGKNILASTPEHGSFGSEGGFWPSLSQIDVIAARGMRINIMNAYYGGKYAKFHDLTQSDISSLTSNLTFGIERISQTPSDFILTVTPVSANIISIASIATQTGMNVLDQNNVTSEIVLDGSIQPNDKIEYNVQISDGTNVFYNVNFEKYYQPTLLLADDPDTNAITTNWNLVGTWTNSNASGVAYSGSRAIKIGSNAVSSYGNNQTLSLTTNNSYDLSTSQEVLVQFYSKWDLERNFDFVEFEGSTDGTNWVSLCGNYNKPKASTETTNEHSDKNSTSHAFQQNNSNGRVYDGDRMDKWVMEEVVINASFNSFLFESPNAQFRFRFRSDGNNRFENYSANAEGFFIDDFKIISVQVPCDNSVAPSGITVDTVTTTSAEVSWDNIPLATYDVRYRAIGAGSWNETTNVSNNTFNITGLTESTDYEVQVATRCSTISSSYSTSVNFTTTTPVPCTGTSISSFPYSESFETGLGLWTQDNAEDFDWTRQLENTGQTNGSTPSSSTGPDGASNGTYFLFIEASNPNFPSKIARLISPCLDFTGRENAALTFDYHMFGGFIGVLTVDVSIDNGATYTTLTDYTLTGAQQTGHTDAWKTQNVDLSLYDGQSIKLRYTATTSSDGTTGWQGDISLDNFGITSDVAGSAAPVAACQNINVQLDASGNATIVATDVDGGSTDDVAITNYTVDIDTFNCSNIGTPVDVTLTVTDADNQTDTCVATVTVLDQIDPEFVNVPTSFILTCGNNQPTWTDPTVTDNCATGLTATRTDVTGLNSGDIFPSGITTISYSTDDGNGNTAITSFTVNVVLDTENPVAICQSVTVQLDGSGNATITAAQINNNSTDNCAISTIVASQTSFTCADQGANNVTLTVTDTNGNVDTCIAVVTITLQDEPATTNCWESTSYNNVSCQWEINGSQDPEPTTECYETATFNTTTCIWDVTGTQPVEPVATNCWDDYQFNNTTCAWENQGTEPIEPTGLECWETTSFNTGTCLWEVSGTQPLEPTAVNCWDDYQFNNTTCAWENQGTEPIEPTAVDCWDDYQFNVATCIWENQGTEPIEPTGLECWETTSFNTGTCLWEVSGTQPLEPTVVNCWDDYQFNNTTCAWENQGTEPIEPTGLECWETTSFNTVTCLWEVSGTQPLEPTGLECWETTSFNTGTCLWEVSGTQPLEPTAVNCWDNYQFNNTTCTWENQGTQPIEPTGLECWEITSFNTGTCLWEVSGTQPIEPTAVDCWDDYQFNNTTCAWENQGTAPIVPTSLNAISISDTAATVTWNDLTPFEYDLRYREVGNLTWIDILDVTTNSQSLTGLTPFTQYEVEVRSKCSATGVSNYSTTLTFVTLEIDNDYCNSASTDASEEYISRVQLADIDNVSDSQNYSDFTAISTVLRKGTAHTITITPTWTGTTYPEAYSVWIDYNKDGDFEDAGEQVVTVAPINTGPVNGNFTIPSSALDTKTRMRVSMKWNDIPDPCEAFQYGEVEDYTVIIVGSNDLIYTSSVWTPYAPSPTTITDNAFVLDGTYTVTDDIQINNMSVCVGAGIVVEKAKAMTVNGILKTGDNVVLESDSNEYSSLFVENFVVGTAQYKRHVNAVASVGGSDLIAPPVYGESFIDFRAENPNLLSNSTNTLFLFGPFDKITDSYLLYTNTETAPLNAGIGYRAASTDAGTFTFTGQVKIGDLSVPVVNDGPTNPEWNLIGNPYPAYIDLNEFLAANNAQFDLPRAGVYGYDGYASDGWTIWNQAYADANPNTLITPGQGFLIASATNNGQIEFTASMRRTGNADDFILGRNASSTINHLQLKLESAQGGAYKTDFYFTDNASNGMDFNYDAAIYGNIAPSNFGLYSHLLEEHSGIDMAIQSLGFDALSNAIIPLGVHVSEGQQLTISISESDLPANVQVYLEDTVNNSFTLLNDSDYIITLSESLNEIGRYFLRFEEETLSTSSNSLNDLSIYTTTQPEALFVKGQLFEDTQLSIYDLQGRLIKSMILSASETSHRIDVSSFNSGVYMVSLKNSFQEKTEKVVIK